MAALLKQTQKKGNSSEDRTAPCCLCHCATLQIVLSRLDFLYCLLHSTEQGTPCSAAVGNNRGHGEQDLYPH